MYYYCSIVNEISSKTIDIPNKEIVNNTFRDLEELETSLIKLPSNIRKLLKNTGNHNNTNSIGYYFDITNPNSKLALYWYLRSANDGNILSKNNLGIFYETRQDYLSALYWYHQAFLSKHIEATYNLANMFYV